MVEGWLGALDLPFYMLCHFCKKARIVFKNFEKIQAVSLYWFAPQQTSTVKTAKNGLFYVKFNVEFNELSLFFLKATRSGQKIAKTKVVRKNPYWHRSEAKVKKT